MSKGFELELKTEYGNVFDIKDSLLNTAIGDNDKSHLFISFYNKELDYVFEYFYCNNGIYIDGDIDADYWTDERIKGIEAKLAETDSGLDFYKQYDDIDLEKAVSIMLDAMDAYSIYVIAKRGSN